MKRHSSIQYFTTNKSVLGSCWLCIGCNTKNLIFPYSKWNNSKTVNWLFHLMNKPSIWKLIVMLLVLWCILAQLADNEKKKEGITQCWSRNLHQNFSTRSDAVYFWQLGDDTHIYASAWGGELEVCSHGVPYWIYLFIYFHFNDILSLWQNLE